ncbi:MAG: DUF3842 family protein [Clostridia bacterium]|nr:DUF3842 family protein [Clostridia bacterium]
MKIVIVDGQGGGIGKGLCEQFKKRFPQTKLIALGTNSLATSAMLRAGADQGATGDNAICVTVRDADLILGPMGLVLANAMLGEISPRVALAIGQSPAKKILIPVARCQVQVAGCEDKPMSALIQDAVSQAARLLGE